MKLDKNQRKAVQDRLAQIAERNDGRLTPDDVVEDARDESSPLHDHFEWDVEKAAAAHWVEQARALITSVMVVTVTNESTVRSVFYVRDPRADSKQQGYVTITTLRNDEDLARDALVEEFARIGDLLRRARSLALAVGIGEEVESLLATVTGLRKRLSDDPPTATPQ